MASHFSNEPVAPVQPAPRKRRHTGRNVAIVVLVIVLLLVAESVMLLVSVPSIRSDASVVTSSIDTLEQAIGSGDSNTAKSSASAAAAAASDMHQQTQGVAWQVASVVPGIGQDIRNVQAITQAADTLCAGALVPVANASDTFSLSNLMQDGKVDVASVTQLANVLSTITPATQQAADAVDPLQPGMIAQVNSQLDNVRSKVDAVNSLATGVSKISGNLPELLGANGQTKNYLIMALNNAEIRPAGGFVGSVGVLSVTDGQLEMGEFNTPSVWDPSQVSLTEGQRALEGDYASYIRADAYFGNSSLDPDFAGTAQLALAHYNTGNPQHADIDGVVGIDPIFLQGMLSLTGGVTADDGTKVDGTNAASELLNKVYLRYPTDANRQDAYLSDIASKCFDTVIGNLGNVSPMNLSSVLSKGAQDHNLQIWFADDNLESQVAEALGVDGKLKTDPASPQVGVYFFTAGGTKIDWYLSDTTTLGDAQTASDGSSSYEATTTLGNHVQASEASSLPVYIAGDGSMIEQVDKGDLATIVYLYAPAGGKISNVQCSAGTFTETTVDGFDVWMGVVKVPLSTTEDITYTVTTSSEATSAPTVRSTATAQEVAGWK